MIPRLFFLTVSALLAACSTTANSANTATVPVMTSRANGLSSQSLAPGECGLFGWSAADAPEFVFFAAPGRALYYAGEGETRTFSPQGPFPSLNYGDYQLTLGQGEPLLEGTRYASARLTETLPDGFTRVRPLVILQSCQTPDRAAR